MAEETDVVAKLVLTQDDLDLCRERIAQGRGLEPQLAMKLLNDRDEWVARAFARAFDRAGSSYRGH